MSGKTEYTKQWESDGLEKLYRRFSVVVRPFEIPLLDLLIDEVKNKFTEASDLTVFEIGSGNGQHTKIILNSLSKKFDLLYEAIDVSSTQRDAFYENSKEFADNIKIVKYEISPWQDYNVQKQYDIVLSQHSWYGIGSDLSNFEKLKNIMSDDGVCFVLLNSKTNLSQIAMENNGEKAFSSEDFEKGAMAVGLKLKIIRSYNDESDINNFYQDSKLTQRALDHFSYLYRRDLKDDDLNVIEMLKSAPLESFRFPTDLIIITK